MVLPLPLITPLRSIQPVRFRWIAVLILACAPTRLDALIGAHRSSLSPWLALPKCHLSKFFPREKQLVKNWEDGATSLPIENDKHEVYLLPKRLAKDPLPVP